MTDTIKLDNLALYLGTYHYVRKRVAKWEIDTEKGAYFCVWKQFYTKKKSWTSSGFLERGQLKRFCSWEDQYLPISEELMELQILFNLISSLQKPVNLQVFLSTTKVKKAIKRTKNKHCIYRFLILKLCHELDKNCIKWKISVRNDIYMEKCLKHAKTLIENNDRHNKTR